MHKNSSKVIDIQNFKKEQEIGQEITVIIELEQENEDVESDNLICDLLEGNPLASRSAYEKLLKMPTFPFLKLIEQHKNTNDYSKKEEIITILGEIGDETCFNYILEECEKELDKFRIRNEEYIEYLEELLIALQKFNNPKSLKVAHRLISFPNENIQLLAISLAEWIGDSKSVGHLISRLKDKSNRVRQKAITALYTLTGKDYKNHKPCDSEPDSSEDIDDYFDY